jgi:hypothetical protein
MNFDELEAWLISSGLWKPGEPKPYAVRTGRRFNETTGEEEYGVHLYYEGAIPSYSYALAGVTGEIKSTGGYVMGVGAIHPTSGEKYEVIPGYDGPLTETPEIIRSRQYELKPKARSKPTGLIVGSAARAQTSAGQRNAQWTSTAGTLRNKGWSETAIFEALMAQARHDFEDGEDYAVVNETKARDIAHRAVTVFEMKDPDFSRPKVLGGAFDFVIAPPIGMQDGWLPRGEVSAIGGASGSMKSSLVLDMLRCQRSKEVFLGHETFGLNFLVLMADRGENANIRTLARMKIDPATIPMLHLEATIDALPNIKRLIESAEVLPEVVFIEGADMLVSDPNKMEVVHPFLKGLQNIAKHYHIAIVVSVGSAKTKGKDVYIAKRDALFGTVAWGRMTETVFILQYPNGDDMSNQRELSVLLRNGPPEKFMFEVREGSLVQIEKTAASKNPQDLNVWVFSQSGWFTSQAGATACGIHEKTARNRFNAMRKAKILEMREISGRHQNEYRVLKFHAPQVSLVCDDKVIQ